MRMNQKNRILDRHPNQDLYLEIKSRRGRVKESLRFFLHHPKSDEEQRRESKPQILIQDNDLDERTRLHDRYQGLFGAECRIQDRCTRNEGEECRHDETSRCEAKETRRTQGDDRSVTAPILDGKSPLERNTDDG